MTKLKSLLTVFIIFWAANANATTHINKEKIDPDRPYLTIQLVYNYDVYKKPIFFKPKAVPTYVIWVEEPVSGYQESVFITLKAAKNKWTFTSSRPEVIPVWYGKKRTEEQNGKLDIDAISAATPRGEMVTIYWQIPEALLHKKVMLYMEANNPFDFNDQYHKKKDAPGYSAANGQPSLIWRAPLDLNGRGATISPQILGHGHVLGKSHAIDPDLSGITTAAETFREIVVRTVMPTGDVSGNGDQGNRFAGVNGEVDHPGP